MKYIVGSVVKSTKGRDKGNLFVVVELVKNCAIIVDGQQRKLLAQKKKNLKHLFLLKKHTSLIDLIENNRVCDADIYQFILNYKSLQKN